MIVELTESIQKEHAVDEWEEQTLLYAGVKNLHAADQLVELVMEDDRVLQFPVDSVNGATVAVKIVVA